MSKYQCNAPIDFMDGTHADAGAVVDLDETKVTDIQDLLGMTYQGASLLVKVEEPPAPAKSARAQKTDTEVTTNG